jgi:transposase-like protein
VVVATGATFGSSFSTLLKRAAMVLENERNYSDRSAAIRAIAPKIGCSRESLRRWVAQSRSTAAGAMA